MLVHYRDLQPTPQARQHYESWINELDGRFADRATDRSELVAATLRDLFMPGRAGGAGDALFYSLDPRNVTLEAEYYSDIDAAKYAERKPLIWLWLMFDRSPLAMNHWLGYRFRAMLARHVFRHCGQNVKIFHGVEVSYGYNLTVEDDCVIHRYVLLDDRGEIIVRRGTTISDYANVYSHAHDILNYYDVTNSRTELGAGARVTYHATVLSGVHVGADAMVGSMAVASKDVPEHHVVAGIPAKTIKVKGEPKAQT